ncbi:MAG: hypothetical protein K6B51_05250 [Bacilli bacterium]|nr:hypothetical protein [Bacilli bacterium]
MRKKYIIALMSMCLLSCGHVEEMHSSSLIQEKQPTKLIVDFSGVSPYAYKGDKLDLSGLSVRVSRFVDFKWDAGEEVSNYETHPAAGEELKEAGELTITLKAEAYTSLEYTYSINVIDKAAYKEGEDFAKALTTYQKDGEEHPLNMYTIGKNGGLTYFNPLSKEQKILVVPYYFDGEEEVANEDNREMIEKTFFATQEEAESANQPYSLKSYYEASSFGKKSINGFVAPWFKSHVGDGSADALANGGVDAAKDIKNQYLAEYEKTNHGLLGPNAYPWTYFDGDGDGFLDFLWIIYSHPMTYGTSNWWAYTVHNAFTEPSNKITPSLRTFCWASIDFLTGRKPHVVVHESGHSMGLVDYYCYNASWSPMGGIAMMDHNIGEQDAFSKFSLGWINPTVVDEDAIIDLKPYASSGEAILLPSPSYNGTAFDEYFLLQFEAPVGLNKRDYLFGSGDAAKGFLNPGLRLLHVDARTKKETVSSLCEEHPEQGTALAYDNSKFGRGSMNLAEKCTTDYFEASNNPSSTDRSYTLISTIPASYEPSRNTINSKGVVLDDNALFRVGDRFDINEGWKEFLPSNSNLWDKARKHDAADYGEVSVDKECTIDFTFEVVSLSEENIRVKIDYQRKGE